MARVIVEDAALSNMGLTASALARKSYGFQPQADFVGMDGLGRLSSARNRNPFFEPQDVSLTGLGSLGRLASARRRNPFDKQVVAPMPDLNNPAGARGEILVAAGPTVATGTGALERAIVKRAAGPTSGLPGLRPSDSQAAVSQFGSAANVAYRLAALRQAATAAKIAPAVNQVNKPYRPMPTAQVQILRKADRAVGTVSVLFDDLRRELKKARATHRAALAAQRKGEIGKANALMSRATDQVEAAKLIVQQLVRTQSEFTRGQIRAGAGLAIAQAKARGDEKLANEIASTVRRFNETRLQWKPQGELESKLIAPEGQTEMPPHIQVGEEDDLPGTLRVNGPGLSGLGDVPASSVFDRLLASVESGAKKAVADVSPELQKQVCQSAVSGGKSAIQAAQTKLSGLGLTASQQARRAYGFQPASDFVGMSGLEALTPDQKRAAVTAGATAASTFVTDAAKGVCPIAKGGVTGTGITAGGGGGLNLTTPVLIGGALVAGIAAWKFGLLRKLGIG